MRRSKVRRRQGQPSGRPGAEKDGERGREEPIQAAYKGSLQAQPFALGLPLGRSHSGQDSVRSKKHRLFRDGEKIYGSLPRLRTSLMTQALSAALVFMVRAYQTLFPPLSSALGIHGHCRYSPSCSEFAVAAIKKEGPARGASAVLFRILSCHPFSKSA